MRIGGGRGRLGGRRPFRRRIAVGKRSDNLAGRYRGSKTLSRRDSLQIPTYSRADTRTRTGDPFITSDGQMSARVRSSHSMPLSLRDSKDWSELEVTAEDNLVDGWWTRAMLPGLETAR